MSTFVRLAINMKNVSAHPENPFLNHRRRILRLNRTQDFRIRPTMTRFIHHRERDSSKMRPIAQCDPSQWDPVGVPLPHARCEAQ